MNQSRLYLLTIGIFLFLFVILTGVVEICLKWAAAAAAPERRDHVVETNYLPVKFKSNYDGQFWGIPFSTNRFGFRDEDFPERPVSNEFRVMSLGDSIGFGLGVPLESHYTKVAERRLNPLPDHRTIRIINAGGQGYSPSGYYVYLKHGGVDLLPHLVLVEIELCNDVTDEALLRWDMRGDDGYPDRVVGGRYLVSWDGQLIGTYSTGSYFFEKSYLYTEFIRRLLFLGNRLFPRGVFHDEPGAQVYYSLGFDQYLLTSDRIESGWTRLFGALKGIQTFCRKNDIDFVLMLMPSRYLFENKEPYTSYAAKIFKRAVHMANAHNLPMLDISTVLEKEGGESLFFDFAHLTVEGNKAVGNALAEELSTRLKGKRYFQDAFLSR